MKQPDCRFCGAQLGTTFVDLGRSPLANSFVRPNDDATPDRTFPLVVFVCDECLLVQLPEFESPAAIFSDYAYFSSFSQTWLDHARRYVEAMTARFDLSGDSQVVEIASNDGYLLRYFQAKGIPVLGIEPAANVAQAAKTQGIPTLVEFFGAQTAGEILDRFKPADLLLGNNVLAHVPDLNDFVRGLEILLAPAGVVTMEFPHVMRLLEGNQFDTIYHEHFSYFSFGTVHRVFAEHGLRVFDVEEVPTHGGSLRIFACHAGAEIHPNQGAVADLLETEAGRGLHRLEGYMSFQSQVQKTRDGLTRFLDTVVHEGKTVAGYGAPAKGNTLLNFCELDSTTIQYTVDRNPHKQGTLLPGSHIPIFAPARIFETRPDFVFILPWNLRDEIAVDMAGISDWGGRFFVAIPEVEVFDAGQPS